GVGVVNQKRERVEPAEEVARHARRAVDVFGAERVLFTPDCGFATFADNPVASATVAEAKLHALVTGAALVRRGWTSSSGQRRSVVYLPLPRTESSHAE